ncbi:hypothetical protein RJ639_000759 [Escallonia herrerae]|uniref:RNA polymerase Rpb1 domain-containing protein n=1 Tax=Escallonia herrerae TaxID=1293975 RepID=A0AA88XAL9_9ASTE|nr:hypothetical protein RJ639_000759 [Escallonia herrerae]
MLDACRRPVLDARRRRVCLDFGILRVGSGRKEGENRAEFVTRKLFPMDGGGGELTQEQSSRPNWVDLTFGQAGSGEVQKLEAYGFQLGTEIATTGDNSWPMPVNLKRLIWNAHKTFKVDLRRSSDMHLIEIVEAVDKLQERLKVVTGDDAMSIEAQKKHVCKWLWVVGRSKRGMALRIEALRLQASKLDGGFRPASWMVASGQRCGGTALMWDDT